MIDDSIVRGTTSDRIVTDVKECRCHRSTCKNQFTTIYIANVILEQIFHQEIS